MKNRIPDQAEKLRQLAANDRPESASSTATLEPAPDELTAPAAPVRKPPLAPKTPPIAKETPASQPLDDKKQCNAVSADPEEKATTRKSAEGDLKSKNKKDESTANQKKNEKQAEKPAQQPKTETSESKAEDSQPPDKTANSSKTGKAEPQAAKQSGAKPETGPDAPANISWIQPRRRFPMESKTRVIAVTGGKGGVGKTNMACNMAIAMRRMNKRVIVFDADLSLANVDVLLGLTPRQNLSHVISGEKTVQDILITGPEGIQIIPGGSGVEELSQLAPDQMERLFNSFTNLQPEPDVFIIDTAAGIHPNVLQFLMAANQTIVVTTPEPPAYTDAYALIKTLVRHDQAKDISVLVNMAQDAREAAEVSKLMLQICRQMLHVTFNNIGYVPRDPEVLKAVRHQTPFLIKSPHCPASRAVLNIAASILQVEARNERGLRGFFRRLFNKGEPPQAAASS